MWWASFDPQAAFAWTTTEWRARFGSVTAAVFRSWAHRDPKRALDTAQGVALRGLRDYAVDGAIAGWDESGKPGLLEAITQLADVDRQRLAEIFARRRVVTLGPAGALRWVDSLEATPAFQQMMAVRIASASAATVEGAPLAAAWATPRVRSDERLSSYPRRIATRWVAHDPLAAMAWLATLPGGADRGDGVAESFRTWVIRDHEAAFAWIEKTEMQPWNEPAMAVYARAIADEHPKQAIELAQRFSDPELRQSTMIVIGQVWSKKDRAAAAAWLAQPGIPERVRRISAMVVDEELAREQARARAERRAEQTAVTGAPPQ
jgi:hypothetical protein